MLSLANSQYETEHAEEQVVEKALRSGDVYSAVQFNEAFLSNKL